MSHNRQSACLEGRICIVCLRESRMSIILFLSLTLAINYNVCQSHSKEGKDEVKVIHFEMRDKELPM